ncbi:hypothetical protein [Streptomyces buecherae]|uniref:hypothetical protein n=1 Tax=Streptomyces buecherae TaxID=2763006 RepID=UPI00379B090D
MTHFAHTANTTYEFVMVPGADIRPADVISRLPGVPVLDADDIDPAYPHSRTLHMADGSLYFCDPTQTYKVARRVEVRPVALVPPPVRVLVAGACQTEAERGDTRAYGFDVADQTWTPATVALHRGYDVRQFDALYLADGALSDPVASSYLTRALACGVPVYAHQDTAQNAVCEGCGQPQSVRTVRDDWGRVACAWCRGVDAECSWCAEPVDNPAPVFDLDTWYVFDSTCFEGHRIALQS